MRETFDEMIEALKGMHLIHDGFREADQALKDKIGVETCISGCGICCKNNTPFAKIIESINSISVLTGQGKLKRALSLAEGWLLDHSKEAKTYEGRPVNLASPQVHSEWLKLRQTQCPFLQDNMQCLVHDVRPLACRAYGVTFEEHDICPRKPGFGETLTQHCYTKSDELRKFVNRYWDQCHEWKSEWTVGGFFPTLLFRAGNEKKFREYVANNQIASAKIVGLDTEVSLLWQPQIEMLRAGMSPDLVTSYR
jgi:Fe-S-cluster containining protein